MATTFSVSKSFQTQTQLLFSCFQLLFSCFQLLFFCFQLLFSCFQLLFPCFQMLFSCFQILFSSKFENKTNEHAPREYLYHSTQLSFLESGTCYLYYAQPIFFYLSYLALDMTFTRYLLDVCTFAVPNEAADMC